MADPKEEARLGLSRVAAGLILNRRGWLLGALAGAVALGAWLFARRSPEVRVRSRVDDLAATLHVDAATRSRLTSEVAPFLTADVTLAAPETGRVEGHAAVLATIIRHAVKYEAADLVLRGATVEIRDGRARVRAEAAVLEHGDQHHDVRRTVDLVLVEDEGEWRVTTIVVGPRDEADPEARP